MNNRRRGDRRGDDRREFRQEEGRRDAAREPRQRWRRRALAVSVPVVLVVVAALLHQVGVVQPDRRAETALAAVIDGTLPVLARTSLPMMAVPGMAGPVSGDPSIMALPLAEEDRFRLEKAETQLDALWESIPRSGQLAVHLGVLRVVLGRDRDARMAWESALVHGGPAQRDAARLGLALVAVRVGLRQTNEQDRLFALEHALDHLNQLEPSLEGGFNRVVVLVVLGRSQEAAEQLGALRSMSLPGASLALLDAWIDTPVVAGAVSVADDSSEVAEGPEGVVPVEPLPGPPSLPTIEGAGDQSTEIQSFGSPE